MSGKPATPAVSRAGVPGPGAPRVLVYVADPRQLETAAAAPDAPPDLAAQSLDSLYLNDNLAHHISLPKNTIYRTQVDHNDHRNLQNTLYYQQSDNSVGQPPEFIANYRQQPFQKNSYVKVYDKLNEHIINNTNVNRDAIVGKVGNVESIIQRVPIEARDLSIYHGQCAGNVGPDHSISPAQTLALPHEPQKENVSVQSVEHKHCGESETLLDKSYVNYQFLEQSVSHQSIVNQSISILNQQVGGSSELGSECEGGNVPQLVRTADGVVLAVLPSTSITQSVDSENNSRNALSEPQTITVPLGWRRIISGASILYISPSGTALSTLPQLRDYLQTEGTCKCGLPCPLRPETAFNFDPKVLSKPYQAASGAELTKLCNHKRKLLASLQARSLSPVTPPPHHLEIKKGGETVKKKMKKRSSIPSNLSVSQLMVQRERPISEFKVHDMETIVSTPSVGRTQTSSNVPGAQVYAPMQQQLPVANIVSPETEMKQETYVQKSSHYLTVNSGWITQQQENVEIGLKQSPSSSGPVGLPVLGTNGQIIGVNTGFNKLTTNLKSVINVPSQTIVHQDSKEEKKNNNIQSQQNVAVKQNVREEESQIFCGLNQPLTPEVMQKINEQQQLFIQQNQKQIEMAMKGFRTQLTENMTQNKVQNQYVSQAQLVIQNGAVVKTNPAKTPPWQVKKSDGVNVNPIVSPTKSHIKQDNEYEEFNATVTEESGACAPLSNDPNATLCSRVPPLPQHYNMMSQQWPSGDNSKKKYKGNNCKASKKKGNYQENKIVPYGNNGMRIVQDFKEKNCDEIPNNNVPSFMDDPSGYLAQQTVLLNNTISRQVNATYNSNHYESSSSYNLQNQVDKSCKTSGKTFETIGIYKSNTTSNPLPSPNNLPDSSVLTDRRCDNNSFPQCCKGCTGFKDLPEHPNNLRMKFVKQNCYKNDLEVNSIAASPVHGFEENPVSTTFIERTPMTNDHNCSPIQAGTVSTSNVSPPEMLQLPEPSPTPSNSSRSTDTPHSSGSNSSHQLSNFTYPLHSPAHSNFSNPSTPGSQSNPYNSPGPSNNALLAGNQMMHFISNHNVNKNLMEVDNISMVGVKPPLKNSQELLRSETRKRVDNNMPGYCPPPHLGGGPAHSLVQTCYIQTFVTTMASGFSVTRDTVTSVLAGKANTATTSINSSQANFIRPPPPPSVNMATSYAIPINHPDPFINSVNLPTSYPLHIAGTTAQNMITKSPLEMMQNVINSPTKSESNASCVTQPRRICQTSTPGQILISSTGQIIVSNNQMPPPPPPKTTTCMSNMQISGSVTNVTTSMAQVGSAVCGVQSVVNPAMVVNNLPGPFVIQPPMMAMDGHVVQQNSVLPQIISSGVVSGHSSSDNSRQSDIKNNQNFVQGVAMLSPESLKKRSKKKKNLSPNITNVLHITAPQPNSNIMVQHTSPQHNSSPQFSPRSFQLSPNSNISPAPMLQALTIVPGKSGTPAHIVMNGQGNTNNFGSQQIIANSSPSQQINLLQPVNLINSANNVMPNFQTFQQFIVPNIGGMVMTADGTAIIQENGSGMPMQLQLQTVNGQNVLTPVQNPGVFTAGTNSGVVIRAQNQQGKILQSQHSPGAQFLSPNSQVMMSSPNFNGQLSPLLANLSPNNVTFNTSPHQVRSSNVQAQEFIQTNQMGQTLMVPLSPKPVSMTSATSNRSNSTLVQQNTTIVQQQTTLVSNSQNSQMSSITANLQGGSSRLSIDPNLLLMHKKARNIVEIYPEEAKEEKQQSQGAGQPEGGEAGDSAHVRHSVSTQTLLNARRGSPVGQAGAADTTTHSPLGALEPAASPRHSRHSHHSHHSHHSLNSHQSQHPTAISTQANYADTTTKSPEPSDTNSSAMVQCVSSSEQDIAESRERAWPARGDFSADTETHNMMPNLQMRQNRIPNSSESPDVQYNHNNINPTSMNNQNLVSQNYYDRNQTYKRKNEFNDGSNYRGEKIMRSNNYMMVHGLPKDTDYNTNCPDKSQLRHYLPSGSNTDTALTQNVMDRHSLGSGSGTKSSSEMEEEEEEDEDESEVCSGGGGGRTGRTFTCGEVVWGPGFGHAMWPGQLERAAGGGRWRVRWFGARSAARSLVPAARLLALSDGLDAHHAATKATRHRKSRKLNTLLENAIQEAMAELDKKSETTETGVASETLAEEKTADIVETPKRNKRDKGRSRDRLKKNNPKTPSNQNKTLRSAR